MSSLTRTTAMRVAAIFSATLIALAGAEVASASPGPLNAAAPLATVVDGPVSVSAPTRVAKNATATITVTAEAGQNGTAQLWVRSTTSGNWAKSSQIAISNGKGSIKVKITTSRAYKVEADGGATSKVFGIAMNDSKKAGITAAFTGSNYVSGELAFITGKAYKNGNSWKKAPVVIQRSPLGKLKWTKIASVTSSSTTGTFTYRFNPSSSYVYRAVISNTYATSAPTSVAQISGDRTLESRAAALSGAIGAASGSIQSVPSDKLTSGVNSARYRNYAKGTLIEVTRGDSVRTWLVYDRMNAKYKSLSRWSGKLGLPMRDMKCGLTEGGCLQRFTGGAVYHNTSSMSKGVYVAYGTVQEVEMLVVARSQAGYVEKKWRKNKYNTWVGGSAAWCSVFVSWTANASGNAGAVPKKKTYATYLSDLKKSGVLKKSGKPPVGAVVLFDWGSGTPTHTGFVRGHSGSSILTIEGNTSNGKGGSARGVYERSRAASGVWAWYWPHEYKG